MYRSVSHIRISFRFSEQCLRVKYSFKTLFKVLFIFQVHKVLIVPEVSICDANLGEGIGVLVYSLDGRLLSQHSFPETLCKAWSVAVTRKGHIVVLDNELDSVFIFDKNNQMVRRFGGSGTEPGKLSGPTFLATSSKDDIIVSDTMNNRVQIFDRNGTFIHMIRGDKHDRWSGGFSLPFGVAMDNFCNILIVDSKQKSILIYKTTGEYMGCIESHGDPLNAPRGITLTDDGHVWVADRDNHCVKKYQYLCCTEI